MKRSIIVCLGLLWMVGAAVGGSTVELTDQTGRDVAVTLPVGRIVSAYGMGTYYLYALGAADRLVRAWYIGVKSIEQAPEEMFRFEPRLGELLASGDPNVEEMAALDPDLILVDASRHGAFADQMGDLGVPVLRFLVETTQALQEGVGLVAEALGDEAVRRARAFAEDFERVLTASAEGSASRRSEARVKVLFLGTDPLTVASGDMYQTLLVEAAGGISATAGLSGSWNVVDMEQILLWNPDVIIIPPYGPVQPEQLLENPDWRTITAVRDGRVHRMPRYIAPMDTPVPESLLGIVWLSSVLYPESASFDLRAETAHFYAAYYGMTLSPDELEALAKR